MLYADYDKALQEINILVKAKNFLVFQVTVCLFCIELSALYATSRLTDFFAK